MAEAVMGSPFDVEARLGELWREASSDGEPVLRACSMNLVVVCDDGERELARTTELVGRIAETVPARALVIGPPRREADDELEVYVSAHCHRGAGGAQVCSEQVTIQPCPSTLDRVPGTVLQLLVEDMPVYTWWRRRGLDEEPLLDPLAGLSDTWVLDSSGSRRPADRLESIRALASRETWPGSVVDLAWVRLEPWRDAVASFFDDPALRPALDGIKRIAIATGGPATARGVSVAGAYLAGWIVSRVDGEAVALSFSTVDDLESGEVSAVTIEADHNDTHVVFDARSNAARDGLSLEVRAGAHRLATRRLRLPRLDTAALACGVVQQTDRDPVFRAALSAAVRILQGGQESGSSSTAVP
jgi:glucose-6-phosphate dehydrogenase assembly protein OpcA